MTGYASLQSGDGLAQGEEPSRNLQKPRLAIELRSVNGRFLDLSFRLPDELRLAEPSLRERLGRHLKRGKVEMRVSVEQPAGQLVPEPSEALLASMAAQQVRIRNHLPGAGALTVSDVLRWSAGTSTLAHDRLGELESLAETAISALMAAREREGSRLAAMLRERIGELRSLAERAQPLVPVLVEQQRQRFLDRWKEAMSLAADNTAPQSAQDRALTEATAFAIRIDVAEELTRLNSHLDELEHLILRGGDIGKRLDFLIQELHREANTMGSKSTALEMTRISVDMKVLIEQMREQVQNIE